MVFWMRHILTVSFVVCMMAASSRAQQPPGMNAELWQTALQNALLDGTDLSFRNDYVQPDPMRLQIVDDAMWRPARVPGWLMHTGRDVKLDAFDAAGPYTDLSLESISPWRIVVHDSIPEPANMLFSAGLPDFDLPRSMLPMVACLKVLNSSSETRRKINWPPPYDLPDSTRAFLNDEVPLLLWEEPEEEFESAEWQDSIQQAEEVISRKLRDIVTQIPMAKIWAEALVLARHFAAWSKGMAHTGLASWLTRDANRTKPQVWETEFGRVAYGSSGPDHYYGAYAFIYDPGGDDVYELEHDPAHTHRVIIDLEGNDYYKGLTDAAIAGGLWGTKILYDVSGDDIYHTRRIDLGAGLYGWGVLIDGAGNDIYSGDILTQGAGAFGLGLLIDSSGNDTYNGALYAQGFGWVGGSGTLYDHSGNDHYNAGGRYRDVLRYKDRYLSLSQGFAYGIRPFLSGGVGLLLDRSGNDDYNCDIFGQGSSYWWGIGGLWDGSGNDRYLAFQYAQGSATHMTVGVLVDEEGDDVYFGKGLMQGCGHDLAPGMLWDLGGNDTYTAWDLSQGAGSANGLGVLYDAMGDDRYYVKSLLNTQGYGNPRRDFGSIGLFLDGGGTDRYDGPGQDSTWWRVSSRWGIGIDFDGSSK